ncbi:MAG: prolyl oligopeptidase family serine peptidase [Firmicutes bacterium]|nr:prolyl oligopeptidase family serine peptidase [Bacillota bacterium]
MKKQSQIMLCISLCLCLISIVFAGAIQTDWGKVDMSEISLETPAGTLTGYLFRPDSATKDNPAPAVVASHGYLNNREMQDCNYVELARRGYVVIAMNAYAHGDSDVARTDYKETPEVRSGGMIEFVRYLATLEYVDASKIGVTGHSMGGGYTTTTMHYFSSLEYEALEAGMDPVEAHKLNLVNTGVVVGNYPSVIASEGKAFLCNVAIIEGIYDEFMASTSLEMLTSDLSHKTLNLQTGLTVDGAIEEGNFYTNPDNGYSIAFYNPPQFHATNHFSTKVVNYLLTAFDHSMPMPHAIAPSQQVWTLKELFNLIGLIGMVLFIVPFTDFLLSTRFFRDLKEEGELYEAPAKIGGYVANNVVVGLINTLLTVPFLLVGYLLLISPLWPQDTTGGVGLWCVICGVVALIGLRKSFGKFKGQGEALHIKTSWKKFGKYALLGLIVSVCTYGLVFLADYINQTDFRIWSFDIRVFSASKIWVAIKYLPFFACYYVVNARAVSRSSFKTWSEGKQMLVTSLFNIMAPALILIITYVPTLFLHKTLWVALLYGQGGALSLLVSAMALIPILMIPFVPILAIAACLGVKLYRRTNSIWPAAIINTLMVTMITIANTSFSFPY